MFAPNSPRSTQSPARRAQRGSALLVVLATVLLFGMGAMAIVRWSALLIVQERDQAMRLMVLRGLSNALDSGQTMGREPAISLKDHPGSLPGDPASGGFRAISAIWTDPHGVERRLVIHTYWHPSHRIY